MNPFPRLLPILAFAAAVLLSTAAMADPSHYTYTVSNDKATITGYTGPGGDITIPDTLGGYAVTSIGYSAFRGHSSLYGASSKLQTLLPSPTCRPMAGNLGRPTHRTLGAGCDRVWDKFRFRSLYAFNLLGSRRERHN